MRTYTNFVRVGQLTAYVVRLGKDRPVSAALVIVAI